MRKENSLRNGENGKSIAPQARLGWETIDQVFLNTGRFAVKVRFEKQSRSTPQQIRNLPVEASGGAKVPPAATHRGWPARS